MKANTKQPGLILIIDTESTSRRERRDVLEWSGLRVEEAANAREGLSLARLLRPEVIFCSRQVGETSGEELLRLLDEEWESGGAWAFVLVGGEETLAELQPGQNPSRDPDVIVPEEISGMDLIETARKYLEQVAEWRAAEERAEEQATEILHSWETADAMKKHATLSWDDDRTAAKGRVHSNQVYEVARETVERLGRTTDLECFIDTGYLPFTMDVLRSVLEELVGNACRFTSPGTRIDLFFIRGAERSVLFIRDYGHGMEAAMAVRLTAGWDSHAKGRGLLAVRRLVREAGASFRVDGGIDEGVTVRIEIPDEARTVLPLTVPEDMGLTHLRIGLPRKQGKK